MRALRTLIIFLAMYSPSLVAQGTTASVFQIVPTPSPNQPYPANNYLDAVSASSGNDIWAVGASVIHFDGETWTGVSAPDLSGDGTSMLTGVADVSPTNVWAVGYIDFQEVNAFPSSIVEHFDGNEWSLFPSPQFPQGDQNFLRAITAISANDIWAGGSLFEDPNYFPLLEHFDGTSWSQSGPPVSDCGIWGISADATNDVWAVGSTLGGGTCTLHYDGSTWEFVTSPDACCGLNVLFGVVALAPDNVWAAGWYEASPNDGRPQLTLIEHWNGVNWKIAASPNFGQPSQFSSQIRGITAISPTDLWAFGDSINISTDMLSTLVLHGDGTNWVITPSPDVTLHNDLADTLDGATVIPPNDLWIVGGNNVFDTLVLNATGR